MSRVGKKVLLFLVFTGCFLILVSYNSIKQEVVKSNPKEETKIILWYFRPRYIPRNMSSLTPISACPHRKCFTTNNKTFLSESQAVIFSAEHIQGDMPPRKPGQVWIFHNNEPPLDFSHNRPFHKPPWSSAFNWTMDFRHDSDIFRPYAMLRKKSHIEDKNYTDIISKKTGMVAIMVSNCWFKHRLKYVRELNNSIPVNIYGGCGKFKFTREQNNEWLEYLSTNYKFYLGLEKLSCPDYISEKFFNNFNLDLITVGQGGGNYSRDVPPGTYINAADYNSPRELAEYLWYLNNNTDKYIDILRKKDQFYYEYEEYRYGPPYHATYLEHYYEKQPLCDLCTRLQNVEAYSKRIENIVPWFEKGACKPYA